MSLPNRYILLTLMTLLVVDTSTNLCADCYEDCLDFNCLEGSSEETNNKDKCLKCKSAGKYLDGSIITGGTCVFPLECSDEKVACEE